MQMWATRRTRSLTARGFILATVTVCFFAILVVSRHSANGNTKGILDDSKTVFSGVESKMCLNSYADLPSSAVPFNVFWPEAIVDFAKEVHFWIFDLLAAVNRPVVLHVYNDANITLHTLDNVHGGLLIFGFTRHLEKMVELVTHANETGVGLFHVGDENGDQNKRFYANPRIAYVLRTYYFEHVQLNMSLTIGKPIMWVPNGYNQLIGPRLMSQQIPTGMRKILCYFGGSMRGPERAELNILLQDQLSRFACRFDRTGGFNRGASSIPYTSTLQSSIFVLCPSGNSVETIRLYEAMENGAIPIMLNHTALVATLKDIPVVFLASWQDLGVILDYYLSHPDELQARQAAVIAGWHGLKEALRRNIALLIHRATISI